MTRRITDLSWSDLDEVGLAAGNRAIAEAHDAGLPTTGMIDGQLTFAERAKRPAKSNDAGKYALTMRDAQTGRFVAIKGSRRRPRRSSVVGRTA